MSAGFQWGRGRRPTLGGCEPLGDAGREPLDAPGSRERRREREAERDRERDREDIYKEGKNPKFLLQSLKKNN